MTNPPGRPIISSNESLLEPLSQFVDFYIRDIVKALPSYVTDTGNVLRQLKDITLPEQALLVSFDVESLYTNIPHEGRIDAPVDFLMKVTKFILESNYFMFDSKFYLQTHGTSMGSPFVPNYANLYVGLWEEKYIFNSSNPFRDDVMFFKRYIDDILCVFIGSEESLFQFRDYLNHMYPSLKFTMEHSTDQIHFLDLLISVNEERTWNTTIFRKETDRNTILHAQSHLPKSLKENIPYGQFLRLERICNKETVFDSEAQVMGERFIQRGYRRETIEKVYNRAKDMDRESLLTLRQREQKENSVTFVSEYSHILMQ